MGERMTTRTNADEDGHEMGRQGGRASGQLRRRGGRRPSTQELGDEASQPAAEGARDKPDIWQDSVPDRVAHFSPGTGLTVCVFLALRCLALTFQIRRQVETQADGHQAHICTLDFLPNSRTGDLPFGATSSLAGPNSQRSYLPKPFQAGSACHPLPGRGPEGRPEKGFVPSCMQGRPGRGLDGTLLRG